MKDCQGNELTSLFARYEEIFSRKVKFYTRRKMYYDHYVDMRGGTLMIIMWRDHWYYTLHTMEDPETPVSENSPYPKQEGAK
jgi:hypothetical protein